MADRGGAQSFYNSLAAFPRAGHRIDVVMPGAPRAAREENLDGIRIHRFPTRVEYWPDPYGAFLPRHIRLATSYAWWLRRTLPMTVRLAREVDADVLFGMGELGAMTAYLAGRRTGLPNVTRLFGTALGDHIGTARMIARYRETLSFRVPASRLIIANDGSSGDLVARSVGVPAERIAYLKNAVDRGRFPPRVSRAEARTRWNLPGDAVVVIGVTRLDREKGVHRLLDAAAPVLDRAPATRFLIAGDGPEAPALRAQAERLGLGDAVRFLGAVDHTGVIDLFAAADILAAVSDRTNLSNPLQEAMVSGLAVVALDTGRTAETVVHGENGLLVDPAHLERLPGALLELITDPEHRRALGRRAAAYAEREIPSVEERMDQEVEAVLSALASPDRA